MTDDLERLYADTGDTRLTEPIIDRALAEAARARSVGNWYGALAALVAIATFLGAIFAITLYCKWVW